MNQSGGCVCVKQAQLPGAKTICGSVFSLGGRAFQVCSICEQAGFLSPIFGLRRASCPLKPGGNRRLILWIMKQLVGHILTG